MLEFLGDPRVFEGLIRGMPGLRASIDRHAAARNGAIPNLMVAPALALKLATGFG